MATSHRCRTDAGFVLAELLVAVLLLALLASGVAALMGAASRALIRSRVETMAVLLAQGRLEQMRSLTWGYGSAHGPVVAIDLDTDLSAREPGSGGTGLGGSPAGALDADTAGFVDYLDYAGRWLAAGTAPPTGARFIRRWSIEHVAGYPDTVMLRVRVIDRRTEVSDIVFATLRTRTAA